MEDPTAPSKCPRTIWHAGVTWRCGEEASYKVRKGDTKLTVCTGCYEDIRESPFQSKGAEVFDDKLALWIDISPVQKTPHPAKKHRCL